MVYDEGFEINAMGKNFFTFFKYEVVGDYTAKNDDDA
jgi:hypothetical protein